MSEAERLAELLDRMADSGKYGAHHSTFHDTATLLRAQSARIAALEDALRAIETAGTKAIEAIDKYNNENGTHLGGGSIFALAKALFTARKALGKGSE